MCLNLWFVWEQFVLLVLLCTNFQYLVLINNLQNIFVFCGINMDDYLCYFVFKIYWLCMHLIVSYMI
jgi:hypothetical protein